MDSFATKFKEFANENDIKYRDISIYFQAFTHKTFANEHNIKCNERLEYIGDAILDFLVGEFLYETYPDAPEGELTKKRASYVNNEANKAYALKLGLDKLLLLGHGEEVQGGRNKVNILGDLFEAFLGAVYMDSKKIRQVRNILKKIVFPDIVDETDFIKDYKSKLQELMQAENRKSVTYCCDKEEGPSNERLFYFSVYFEGAKLGEGVGRSKKEAEQAAAKDALEKLAK